MNVNFIKVAVFNILRNIWYPNIIHVQDKYRFYFSFSILDVFDNAVCYKVHDKRGYN